MPDEPRMTYDNQFIEIDVILEYRTEVQIQRDNRLATIDQTELISRNGKTFITLRKALQLGIVTEFDFQRIC